MHTISNLHDMENIELIENILLCHKAYSMLPEWDKIVEELEPLILQIMKDSNIDNPVKAVMPVIKEAKENGDVEETRMIMAVAINLAFKNKN